MRIPYDEQAVFSGVTAIIHTRAHPIETLTPVSVVCTSCGGSDPFCPACQGTSVQTTYTGITLSGLVRWRAGDRMTPRGYGMDISGDCQFVFAITSSIILPETHVLYAGCITSGISYVVSTTQYYRIYDRLFQPVKVEYKGKPLNRVYVTCVQVTIDAHRPV